MILEFNIILIKKCFELSQGPYYIVSRSVTNTCNISGSKNEVKNTLAVYKIDRIREVFRGNVIVPYDVTNITVRYF